MLAFTPDAGVVAEVPAAVALGIPLVGLVALVLLEAVLAGLFQGRAGWVAAIFLPELWQPERRLKVIRAITVGVRNPCVMPASRSCVGLAYPAPVPIYFV